MAIAFRAVASLAYGSHATSSSVSKPTGTVDGDIMVMTFCAGHASAGSIAVDTFPSGWTTIGTPTGVADPGSFTIKMWVFWKRASSEGSTYTFSHTTTMSTSITIASYSGCLASGSPVDVFSQNGLGGNSSSTSTGTGVTTTVANTILIYSGHNWDGLGTLTPPTGMTERFDGLLYLSDEARATAAATSNRTQSLASGNPWQAYLVALKPAGATAYTLAAAAGSYAMTGTAATLKHGWKPAAAGGSYAMTGTAATPAKLTNRSLSADPGSYAMTGTTAATKHGWKPAAVAGSYAMTGVAASPKRGFGAAASAGSYAMTGTAANQNRTWRPIAAAGAYVMLGTAALPTKVAANAAFRAVASTAYASRTTTTSVAIPVGTADGDIMVMALFAGRAGVGSETEIVIDTFPPGWTQIGTTGTVSETGSGFNAKFWVFWKRASSEGASYNFLHTVTLSTSVVIASYSGCLTTGTPLDVFSQNSATATTTAIATSVTTTASNDKLIYVGHNWDGTGLSPPSGMTERFDGIVYLSDEDVAAIGATGNRTQSPLATPNPWQAYLVALKPARTSIALAPPPFNPAVFLPFLVR